VFKIFKISLQYTSDSSIPGPSHQATLPVEPSKYSAVFMSRTQEHNIAATSFLTVIITQLCLMREARDVERAEVGNLGRLHRLTLQTEYHCVTSLFLTHTHTLSLFFSPSSIPVLLTFSPRGRFLNNLIKLYPNKDDNVCLI